MTSDAKPRNGQPLRASYDTEWTRRRLAADLSVTELAARSKVPRSIVGLICQGRLIPTPDQAAALLRAFEGPAA